MYIEKAFDVQNLFHCMQDELLLVNELLFFIKFSTYEVQLCDMFYTMLFLKKRYGAATQKYGKQRHIHLIYMV